MKRPTLFGSCLYWFGHSLFYLFFRTIWRLQVHGSENIPRNGRVIFASNHLSMADPPLVGCSIPRAIHFMAKKELFEVPVFGWIIRQVNAFPLRRAERDVGAFKTAQRILDAGDALILFPEGHRQRRGVLARPKAGVGMLSSMTRSPVVPVYVHNSNRLWSFKPLTVCFGRPLENNGAGDYQAFSEEVMSEIAALKEKHCGSAN